MFWQFEIAKNLPSYLPCNRFFQGDPYRPIPLFRSILVKTIENRVIFLAHPGWILNACLFLPRASAHIFALF